MYSQVHDKVSEWMTSNDEATYNLETTPAKLTTYALMKGCIDIVKFFAKMI